MIKRSSSSRYIPTINQIKYPNEDQISPINAKIVKELNELNNLYINLDNYFEDEIENGFLKFKLNNDIPFTSSDQDSKSVGDSSTNSGNWQLFLTHYYEEIPNPSDCQIQIFKDQIMKYYEKPNESLSRIQGLSFANINGHFFPIAFTERPTRGSLSSLFTYTEGQIGKVKITPEGKFSMIIQIIQGISFIHKKKFIHSNLNPTTVYLNEKLDPVICDHVFIPQYETTLINGEYQYSISSEKSSQIYKSDIYVAPEILRGGTFDKSVDIYSLGAMILFILSEKEPTKNGDSFDFPSDFPEKWREIVEKCTKIDPAERMKLEEIYEILDKEKAAQLISSINPKIENNDISEKTDRSISTIKHQIENDFSKIEFKIFQDMIPNMNDIDEYTKSVISAAENGHVESLEKIAEYFHTGEHNFYADDVYSFECYEYAASKNSVFSHLKIAEYYEKGIGINIKLESSIEYYMKALDLMENDDTRRSEIERKINEISDKMRTIKLIDVPLSISEEKIRRQFKNIESIDVQKKNETNQDIFIKFKTLNNLKTAEKKINKMKNDKYIFETYYSKKKKTNRFDSLDKKLPRLNLGDFHISEEHPEDLGSGKFASVYLVYKDGEDDPYVAKIFIDALESNYDINSFKREVIMSSEFKNYPSIVQYVGFNEYSLAEYLYDKGKVKEIKPTLFMKYVPGGNIEDAIHSKPKEWWDDTKKLKIVIGIAAGLSEIHNHSIMHRDMKPLNVLLDENSEPVICDFGSARHYSLLSTVNVQFTESIGTAIYMAPELYKSMFNNVYSGKVDSYSFAIVMYQILTLSTWDKIFPINNSVKVMNKKMENYVPSLDNIKSDLLKNIINTCWNTSARDRYSPQKIYKTLVDNIYSENPNILPNADINQLKKYIEKFHIDQNKDKET